MDTERKSKIDLLSDELSDVAEKHGLRNCSFCGINKDDEFVGMFLTRNVTTMTAWESILNVGRLWQHARETSRTLLNTFERNDFPKQQS